MDFIGSARAIRWRFVATITLGSFLLFLVQPLVARLALPRLGGAPSVWNSAMLVYQALLLGGYAYAHWLGKLGTRAQFVIHLALFALAALTLPISLGDFSRWPEATPFVRVPLLLLTSIGPVFFAVAAQAPLLQRWFTLSGGEDPYPLYAASNLGSFSGLLAYPLIVEPWLSAVDQTRLWGLGYTLLMLLIALCALAMPRQPKAVDTLRSDVPLPDRATVARWILLAAVPSGLMLSTSLHLTTDIVAMPLLWVLPLGLYLLSFSVAFAANRRLADLCTRIAPFALLMAGAGAFIDATPMPFVMAAMTLLSLFVIAVSLHSEMFARRPDPAHLTRFYLAMSIGGVIGGLFCALLAPLLFNWGYEHPILLAATAWLLVPRPIFALGRWLATDQPRARWVAVALVVAVLLISLVGMPFVVADDAYRTKLAAVILILLIALLSLGQRQVFCMSLIALMLCLSGWSKLALSAQDGMLTRSYFGAYAIRLNSPTLHSLVHGTTLHGLQDLTPGRERAPTSYYAPKSGVGLAMAALPALAGPRARVAIVGLGIGTLGCYAQPGQSWHFYEIDPVIVEIARDARYFSFVKNCQPNLKVSIGDARLTLAAAPPHAADLLVIDAFSSDSVPMHLLTREAFAIYRRHLAPHGLLMVHISNRYLNLRPVVAAAAQAGWSTAERAYQPDAREITQHYAASIWVAMAPDRAVLETLKRESPAGLWQPLIGKPGFSAWTDDHASILPILALSR